MHLDFDGLTRLLCEAEKSWAHVVVATSLLVRYYAISRQSMTASTVIYKGAQTTHCLNHILLCSAINPKLQVSACHVASIDMLRSPASFSTAAMRSDSRRTCESCRISSTCR